MSDAVNSTMRYHYMDAMRSILMLLGVVVHASQIFNPQVKWLVSAVESLPLAGAVVAVLTTFRMPAFFIVSGFFSLMMLHKYQGWRFLRFRFQRIFVPIVFVALTLNLAQTLVLKDYRNEVFSWLDYVAEDWLGHLWFLLYLLIYCLLLVVIAGRFSAALSRYIPLQKVAKFFLALPLPLQLLAISIVSPLLIKCLMVLWPLNDQIGRLFYLSDLLFYSQFFLIGALFFRQRKWLEVFTLYAWWRLALILCVALAVRYVLPEEPSLRIYQLLDQIVHVYSVWLASSLCFQFFFRCCNSASPLFLYLSDGSYTIYLVHHVLVITLGIGLLQAAIPSLVAWPLLIVVVVILSVAAHELVRRLSWLRLLLNGK